LISAIDVKAQNILSQGHHPLSVGYSSAGWNISVAGAHGSTDSFDVADVIFHMSPASQLTIPGSSLFSFLGEPGSPVWIAPSIENPNILQLGIGGNAIPNGVFMNDRLKLNLISVTGPGDFAMYTNNSSGGVDIWMNSADGINGADSSDFSTSGHDHPNWAFNAAGYYQLTWNVSGTLSQGNLITSENFTSRYAVGDIDPIQPSGPVIIDEGDADIAVIVDQDAIVLEAFWGVEEMAYDHDEVIYRIKANSRVTVSDNPNLQFLGEPGSVIWVGPQTETDGRIYLAMAADNFPTGLVTQDKISVQLVAFEGPGDMFVYAVDSFGTPTINFNTRDGLSPADARDLFATDHSHLNWAFTAPGIYTLDLKAEATRVSDGSPITSEVTRFTFEVRDELKLNISQINPANIELMWNSALSNQYQLIGREKLETGDWIPLGNPIYGNGQTQSISLSILEFTSQFYKLIESGSHR
jgi:surface-anchored protein